MKKIAVIALAFIAVAACNKNALPETSTPKSFTLQMPQLTPGDKETKTELILNGESQMNQLAWSSGDKLFVTTKEDILANNPRNMTLATYKTVEDKVVNATFTQEGETAIPAGSTYIVFYQGLNTTSGIKAHVSFAALDIPTTQTYVENGIAKGTMPVYGHGTDLKALNMECPANIIRMKLYDGSDSNITVRSIVLSKPHSTSSSIAGRFAISKEKLEDLSANNMWDCYDNSSSGTHSMTYDCSESGYLGTTAGTAKVFNMVISGYHGNTSYVTATITYTKGTDPTIYTRTKELTSLTPAKQVDYGHIYTFPAKDISNDTLGYWD